MAASLEPLTIPQVLAKWVQSQPDKRLWTFLDDDGHEVDSLTYLELDDKSRALATALLSGARTKRKPNRGERVLLVYPPSLHFIVAFVACLRAGLVAVPVYPPDPRRLGRDLGAFATTAESCGAAVALTSTAYDHVKKVTALKQKLTRGDARWPEGLEWVVTDTKASSGSGSHAAAALTAAAAALNDSPPAANDLAFLQYTSGSTSEPKGVCVAHRNLAHNLSLIVRQLGADTATVVVSWLPQYHDMGLVGSYLGVLYCGGSGYYLSPLSFIRSPPAWVIAISRYRGTHMQAPNFAYALTARKWRALRSKPPLDLACVRHMINGAEPVDVSAMDGFEATFAEHGLPRGVIFPTYGLAEHTVFVCSNGRRRLRLDKCALEVDKKAVSLSKGEAEAQAQSACGGAAEDVAGSSAAAAAGGGVAVLAGCGVPDASAGVEVLIVDPEARRALPEGHVGEVWVQSPSRACGYWGMPAESDRDFKAELCSDFSSNGGSGGGDSLEGGTSSAAADGAAESGSAMPAVHEEAVGDGIAGDALATAATVSAVGGWERGYLRTGDEGFLDGGELFICGRIKDLIIIGGRNHYPQDLERTVERIASDEIRPGCSAAFSVSAPAPDVGERLVLTCELREGSGPAAAPASTAALAERLRSAVVAEHQLSVWHLLLLPPRTNRKTTSGKIARRHCRREYLLGGMKPIFDVKSADTTAGDEAAAAAAAVGELRGDSAGGAAGAAAGSLHEVDIAGDGMDGARAADAGAAGGSVASMADEELLRRLQTLLGRLLDGNDPPDPDAPLYGMGATSLAMAQFSGALQQDFGANVPLQVLDDDDTTLRSLVPLIKRGGVKKGAIAAEGVSSGAMPAAASGAAAASATGPAAPVPQVMEPREPTGSCEQCITNSCPCCLCLLSCPCCR